MNTIQRFSESAYDWAKIPEDLPRSNLFLITAKTASPTIHPEKPNEVVRLFSETELHESAKSLARRPIGLNHGINGAPFIIDFGTGPLGRAWTVDSQYNPSTKCIEALIYVPNLYRDMINLPEEDPQKIRKVSVEFYCRDEVETELGVEYVGLVFDKVDLIQGMNAGDKLSEIRRVEAVIGNIAHLEGEIIPQEQKIKQDQIQDGIEDPEQGFYDECYKEAEMFVNKKMGEPFAGYKDFDACVAANKDKGNPSAYCGYIKHKVEDKPKKKKEVFPESPNTLTLQEKKETEPQRPETTNVMNQDPTMKAINQEPIDNTEPVANVASAGAVVGTQGVLFGEPEPTNTHKNLDIESSTRES